MTVSLSIAQKIPATLTQPTVYINLAALQHNATIARSIAPRSQLIAIIKANAYGHGLIETAEALKEIVDGFGVARLDEATRLRQQGCDKTIVVMSPLLNKDSLAEFARLKLSPVLYYQQNFRETAAACDAMDINYWVKIDSGMHRLGLAPDCDQLHALLPALSDKTLMTHLKSAEYSNNIETVKQLTSFKKTLEQIFPSPSSNTARLSIANSAALLQHCITKTASTSSPNSLSPLHIDIDAAPYERWLSSLLPAYRPEKESVRPGIMLYGADPLEQGNETSRKLIPVMTLAAPIIDIHQISAGATVGYNGKWTAERDSTIATVGVGYADGYPRHAKNGTPVLVHGHRVPLVGRVSMDMIGVDISDLLAQNITVTIGDTAILWGEELLATDIAEHSGTISYALLPVSPTELTAGTHKHL